MKKKLLSLSLVAGFLMTIMSGTMAFAVNADENANVLTAENAVIVENGIPRIISSAEAEQLFRRVNPIHSRLRILAVSPLRQLC